MSEADESMEIDGVRSSHTPFPLQHEWVFWFNEKPPRGVTQGDFEKSITNVGAFSTVENFWQHFNNLKPEKLPLFSTLRLFKTGIKPCWEDPANYHGGKWVLNTNKEDTSEIWGKIVLAAIGNSLDCSDELCGVVLSLRPDKDTIQIWNRSADPAVYQKITTELHRALGLSASEELTYQIHAGSMDFNANVQRNRNSPTLNRRRPLRENGGVSDHVASPTKQRRALQGGNGFLPSSTSAFTRTTTKTTSSRGNGYRTPSSDAIEGGHEAEPTTNEDETAEGNGHVRNGIASLVDTEQVVAKEEEPEDEDDGLFKDSGKGTLNKSWGDMGSDSEDGSDDDNIWGGKTEGKVDWGELAEEEEEDEDESSFSQPARNHTHNSSSSVRWSDEMEEWEAENGVNNTEEEDGFVCVGRKRRGTGGSNGNGDSYLERRSVSQDVMLTRKQVLPNLSVPAVKAHHKRASSTEIRDGSQNSPYNKRGRRGKGSHSARAKADSARQTGSHREFSRSDSVSPRDGKLLEAQKHKRSVSSEQGEAGKGRRLSQSQDGGALRRKAGGNRPISPGPSVLVRPPPGLKGKAWSPVPTQGNQASWAQVTQGNKNPGISPRSTPTANVAATPNSAQQPEPRDSLPAPSISPRGTSAASPRNKSPRLAPPSVTSHPDRPRSPLAASPRQQPPIAVPYTHIPTVSSREQSARPTQEPTGEVSPSSVPTTANPPASSVPKEAGPPSIHVAELPPACAPTADSTDAAALSQPHTQTDQSPPQTNETEHRPEATPTGEGTTTPASAMASAEAQADGQDGVTDAGTAITPRKKEKRKRKRNSLKRRKDKDNPDLSTHWFLLLSLIVLSCSVFCGFILVHFLQSR